MRIPGAISPKLLLLFALVLISLPIHIKVKNMLWHQKQELLSLGERAPHFKLSNEMGRMMSITDLTGKKPFILSFCKTTEPVCHSQATELNVIVREHGHKGLEVFLVADSATALEIKNFDKKTDAEFHILRDNGGKIKKRYNVEIFPTNYFIDRYGRVVTAYPGKIRGASGQIRKLAGYLLGEEQ